MDRELIVAHSCMLFLPLLFLFLPDFFFRPKSKTFFSWKRKKPQRRWGIYNPLHSQLLGTKQVMLLPKFLSRKKLSRKYRSIFASKISPGTGVRPIRHPDFSMYNNCFFENWYQQSRDRDFHWIVQYCDFVKGGPEPSNSDTNW